MKPLSEYINEAAGAPATGIGAFCWGAGHSTTIDTLRQQLPGLGFEATKNHVTNNEYKITHNGHCMTIGVRPKATGEGTRQPSAKIFVRSCCHGKLSIVEKYMNIDGDGKATYKVLSVDGEKFIWTPCKVDELPKEGTIDDTSEFALLFIKKIQARTKRYTK
jgi:hypothetical protein